MDNFGFNNTNLTTNDITSEITHILDKIKNPELSIQIREENYVPPPTGEPVPIHTLKDISGSDSEFVFGTETNSLYIKNELNDNIVYFKIGNKDKSIVFYSTTSNNKGSFEALRERVRDARDVSLNMILGKDHLELDGYARTQILKKIGRAHV